jgi:hypothetical protein
MKIAGRTRLDGTLYHESGTKILQSIGIRFSLGIPYSIPAVEFSDRLMRAGR